MLVPASYSTHARGHTLFKHKIDMTKLALQIKMFTHIPHIIYNINSPESRWIAHLQSAALAVASSYYREIIDKIKDIILCT